LSPWVFRSLLSASFCSLTTGASAGSNSAAFLQACHGLGALQNSNYTVLDPPATSQSSVICAHTEQTIMWHTCKQRRLPCSASFLAALLQGLSKLLRCRQTSAGHSAIITVNQISCRLPHCYKIAKHDKSTAVDNDGAKRLSANKNTTTISNSLVMADPMDFWKLSIAGHTQAKFGKPQTSNQILKTVLAFRVQCSGFAQVSVISLQH